ncbi:hypothetical protein [Arsenophonus sp. PmNCSU2021_1]|uniref:hypothetical protein n=1 Tax=Arsenophonus sp. PmNCSU2021_1 TaxID=3118989 RepID=UPI002FF3DFED
MELEKIEIRELISAESGWYADYKENYYPVMAWARCCVLFPNGDLKLDMILPCLCREKEIKPIVNFDSVYRIKQP